MSFIARICSAKFKLNARPLTRTQSRGSWSRRLQLACLVFLAFGIQADEPESRNDPPQFQPFYQQTQQTAPVRHGGTLARKPRDGNLTSQFEEPPQRMDLFQVEQLQIKAAENRERTRKRIVLPPEAVAVTNLAPPPPTMEARMAAAARAQVDDSLHQGFLFILLLIACGLLAIRKFVPEFNDYMDTLLNPWTLATASDFERSAIVLEEEKSFTEFRAKFRVGPSEPGAANARLDGGEAVAELFSTALRHIEGIQKLVQQARLGTVEIEQRRILRQVYEKIQPLKDLMFHPELRPLEQMTCALEPLVKKLTEKAGNVTSSSLRTVNQGVELLGELCQPEIKRELLGATPLRFLVVDDETFSRFALATALKRTLAAPDVAETVETALKFAASHTYDLIFLDVQMPGMDGFELCSKIHEMPLNRQTPVIFVTSLRDFDSRAKSIVCGGRDLISKPFLTFELTVKALTLAARERLHGRGGVATDSCDAATKNAEMPIAAGAQSIALREVPGADTQSNALRSGENSAAKAGECAKDPIPTAKPESTVPAASHATEDEINIMVTPSKTTTAFRLQAKAQATGLRELVDQIQACENKDAQKELITNLLLRVHSLAVGAEAGQQQSLAQISAALEGLVKKLVQNARNVTASTLQAVAAAVSLIQEMCAADPGLDEAIGGPIRVLAVDDDPLARRFMTNALQLNFFLPQNAADGTTAVELAAKEPFDVIFLDVQMPGLDGFAACHQIRQSMTNRGTPVVFVTSNDDASMKAKAGESGAADFIAKPYVCSELTLKTITLAFLNRLTNPVNPIEKLLPVAANPEVTVP